MEAVSQDTFVPKAARHGDPLGDLGHLAVEGRVEDGHLGSAGQQGFGRRDAGRGVSAR